MLTGYPPQEFVVKNSGGDEVWSSLATTYCTNGTWAIERDDCVVVNGFRTSGGQDWEFGPGEEKALSGTWDGTTSKTVPVQPGEYFISGLVHFAQYSDEHISLEPVTITSQPVSITVLP